MEIVRMVTTIHTKYDHLLKSQHLIKKDDLGVSTILCSINRCYFYKTICDTKLSVNLMANITSEFLYGTMPMDRTYAQLQMVDQSFRFMEGIVKDIPIQIDDHYNPLSS